MQEGIFSLMQMSKNVGAFPTHQSALQNPVAAAEVIRPLRRKEYVN